jgi:hypothetical protein
MVVVPVELIIMSPVELTEDALAYVLSVTTASEVRDAVPGCGCAETSSVR